MTPGSSLTGSASRYRVYGLALESDLPLPELVPLPDGEPDAGAPVTVRLAADGLRAPGPPQWVAGWTLPTGEPWLRCAKVPGGYLLRFPALADFTVDARGGAVALAAGRGVPPETLRHLLLDQVLPLVVNLRGGEALHATAVLTPRGLCAFAGPAGAGKSTLGASFLLAGHPVVSDDCLALGDDGGRVLGTPGYPSVRLWDDARAALGVSPEACRPVAHYTAKHRLSATTGPRPLPAGPHPVRRIYVLARDEGGEAGRPAPGVEHLTPRDAFMALIGHAFRLDPTDRAMLSRQFRAFERVVSRVRVSRLRVPEGLSSLAATRDAVLEDLEAA